MKRRKPVDRLTTLTVVWSAIVLGAHFLAIVGSEPIGGRSFAPFLLLMFGNPFAVLAGGATAAIFKYTQGDKVQVRRIALVAVFLPIVCSLLMLAYFRWVAPLIAA